MTETILVDVASDGVATVVLNRPDRGNAFSQTMLDELGTCFEGFREDPRVRVVILRGKGRHFCTGADMSGRGETSAAGLGFNDVLSRIDRLPKATIAVVQGGCLGGGLGMAACCDVLLADENAFFSVPELRVGIAPSSELAGLLIRAMGHRAFRRYGLSGERIAAEEALRIRLVHQVLGSEALERQIAEVADAFLRNAPGAFAELKQTIAQHASPEESALFPPGGVKSRGLARSAEAIEGMTAFREKRKPSWYPPGSG